MVLILGGSLLQVVLNASSDYGDMMIMTKTGKILLAVVCATISISALTSCKANQNAASDESSHTAAESETTNTFDSHSLVGSWFSDRENGDILTFNEDGTFSSSAWLKNGTFSITGKTVYLTDALGMKKTLSVGSYEGSATLVYSDESSGHTYYRTQAELNEVKIARESVAAEEQEFNKDAVMKILTTGEWLSTNGFTLSMTDTSFTVSKNESHPNYGKPAEFDFEPNVTYRYQIASIERGTNVDAFFIKVKVTDENGSERDTEFTIGLKGDNTYTLFSYAFPYAASFTKTVVLDFDIGPMSIQETQQNRTEYPTVATYAIETEAPKETIIVHPDGSKEKVRRIRRVDVSDSSESSGN